AAVHECGLSLSGADPYLAFLQALRILWRKAEPKPLSCPREDKSAKQKCRVPSKSKELRDSRPKLHGENFTSGIFLSKKMFLWVTLIESATARSDLITPKCLAAAAIRVWQRASILLRLAVFAAEPTAIPKSTQRSWQMDPANCQSGEASALAAALENSAHVPK